MNFIEIDNIMRKQKFVTFLELCILSKRKKMINTFFRNIPDSDFTVTIFLIHDISNLINDDYL